MTLVKFRLAMIAVVAAFVFDSGNLVYADEQPIRILTMQTPPYGFLDENNNETGVLHELNLLILKQSGLKAEIVMKPLARMIRDFQLGAADCTILAGVRNVRERFQLVAKLRQGVQMGIVPRKHIEINSYDDLAGLKIALPLGILLSDEFDGDDSLNKIQIRNYQDGLNLLVHGRIDALAGVVETLHYLARHQEEDQSDKLGKPFILEEYGLFFVCRKDYRNEAKLDTVRKAIDDLNEAGKIKELIGRYLE